jgi:hypothetical protein
VDIVSQPILLQYQVQVNFLAALMAVQSRVLKKSLAVASTENVKN